jgi:hypothetical protein
MIKCVKSINIFSFHIIRFSTYFNDVYSINSFHVFFIAVAVVVVVVAGVGFGFSSFLCFA